MNETESIEIDPYLKYLKINENQFKHRVFLNIPDYYTSGNIMSIEDPVAKIIEYLLEVNRRRDNEIDSLKNEIKDKAKDQQNYIYVPKELSHRNPLNIMLTHTTPKFV